MQVEKKYENEILEKLFVKIIFHNASLSLFEQNSMELEFFSLPLFHSEIALQQQFSCSFLSYERPRDICCLMFLE